MVFNQLSTVDLKLEIINPTPMETATDTISAATAIDVRLRPFTRLRGANLPTSRLIRTVTGWISFRINTINGAVRKAKPRVIPVIAVKPVSRLRDGILSTMNENRNAPAAINKPAYICLRERCSTAYRESASLGGTDAASKAGGIAVSTVVISPSRKPLIRLVAEMRVALTVVVK